MFPEHFIKRVCKRKNVKSHVEEQKIRFEIGFQAEDIFN